MDSVAAIEVAPLGQTQGWWKAKAVKLVVRPKARKINYNGIEIEISSRFLISLIRRMSKPN
jgi:hypothetical protein